MEHRIMTTPVTYPQAVTFGAKSPRWQDEIAERYDVTSITLSELQRMSNELHDKKLIDDTAHDLLSFHMQICSNFDMFVALLGSIMSDSQNHRNFLQLWHQILHIQERDYPYSTLTQRLRGVMDTLESIHHSRSHFNTAAAV